MIFEAKLGILIAVTVSHSSYIVLTHAPNLTHEYCFSCVHPAPVNACDLESWFKESLVRSHNSNSENGLYSLGKFLSVRLSLRANQIAHIIDTGDEQEVASAAYALRFVKSADRSAAIELGVRCYSHQGDLAREQALSTLIVLTQRDGDALSSLARSEKREDEAVAYRLIGAAE